MELVVWFSPVFNICALFYYDVFSRADSVSRRLLVLPDVLPCCCCGCSDRICENMPRCSSTMTELTLSQSRIPTDFIECEPQRPDKLNIFREQASVRMDPRSHWITCILLWRVTRVVGKHEPTIHLRYRLAIRAQKVASPQVRVRWERRKLQGRKREHRSQLMCACRGLCVRDELHLLRHVPGEDETRALNVQAMSRSVSQSLHLCSRVVGHHYLLTMQLDGGKVLRRLQG